MVKSEKKKSYLALLVTILIFVIKILHYTFLSLMVRFYKVGKVLLVKQL